MFFVLVVDGFSIRWRRHEDIVVLLLNLCDVGECKLTDLVGGEFFDTIATSFDDVKPL